MGLWRSPEQCLPPSTPQAWLINLCQWQESPRCILNTLVHRCLKADRDTVAINHAKGQPPRCLSHPHVNLSYASRGTWAAFAVALCPVGVDVELFEPDMPIPWNVLHPNEQVWISAGVAPERFAQVWTGKEAYLKAIGTGLMQDATTVDVLALGNRLSWYDRECGVSACCCLLR